MTQKQITQGLYNGEFHDNCGFGLLADINGKQSHGLVKQSIKALNCMTHRGGINSDGKTGDGCGLLLQMPHSFVRKISELNFSHPLGDQYALGMIFLSQEDSVRDEMKMFLDKSLQKQGLHVVGWRNVAVDPSCLGEVALADQPIICQVLVETPEKIKEDDFLRRLFVAGREAEKHAFDINDEDFYICSLSSQVLSYKGLMMPRDLTSYYSDLSDTDMASSICVFHQRFSTNTLPKWKLAQPFRCLAHNGEINTISSNRANMKARERDIFTSDLGRSLKGLSPLVREDMSDSASFDQVLELMLMGDVGLLRAVRMMVPPAWEKDAFMPEKHKAMHEYSSLIMEPWDGPAGLVMTDGRYAVCMLDRNGLRPVRWSLTESGIITLASEAGVNVNIDDTVVQKGRVGPGEMIVVDTHTSEISSAFDVDQSLSSSYPFKKWLHSSLVAIDSVDDDSCIEHMGVAKLAIYRKMFSLTQEECDANIQQVVESKLEPVGAMGDDAPMAVLSRKERVLSDYFRQMFAQVTNPAIDPLREGVVMSLTTCLGPQRDLFVLEPPKSTTYRLESPVLSPAAFKAVVELPDDKIKQVCLQLQYQPDIGLEAAIDGLLEQAEKSVIDGATVIIISDKGIDRKLLPINSLLATGAIHHHLVACGLRTRINIIVETGFARDSHHFACLFGVGATAVYPYLSFAYIKDLLDRKVLVESQQEAINNYVQGINKGLLKIMSKMGISCISSYRGSQLFEAVGIGMSVVDRCFAGMVSRIGGADFSDIEKNQKKCASKAWLPHHKPLYGGRHKWTDGGEYHAYNPDVVTNLRLAARTGEASYYERFSQAVNKRQITTLRDMLRLNSDRKAIDISLVEPVELILKRFDSAAMSLGALSPEAHESLAQAMNEMGARSNSGEGGEDAARYGTVKSSKIKQIASGRFGVTAAYLVNAEVLQIKVSQGAKPGEGGQLPGGKVTDLIARLRYSTPGTTLISPPPHHDIYSIEDLAQLIFDLKQVNPKALVSVKLVSEPGVGTVASGVVKAYADLITVSGYDGGTAASPLSSIHYAGSPWELGLSEVQQSLRANGLRSRVRVQTDGGLKTGLDVVKAAILGAESFGFGTAPMIAMGCKYLRICHLNNCATGVATQSDKLREEHFIGTAAMVKNYFHFVAQEVREILASLGYSSLEDIVGQVSLLDIAQASTEQQSKLDLKRLLFDSDEYADQPRISSGQDNKPFDKGELGKKMLQDSRSYIEAGSGAGSNFVYEITNSDRSCGAAVSGEIARKWGTEGLREPIVIRCHGVAGQSFGVWNSAGLDLMLDGEANDYVGKGMSGGRIVISSDFVGDTPIVGNTCLYGATGGTFYASGMAGERFAVRNSGATAVIEGAGDHCCEYMTGGVVVVLGSIGSNFGAGMTGGVAFVLVEDEERFVKSCNTELVAISQMEDGSHASEYLYDLLSSYQKNTGSAKAADILGELGTKQKFYLVHSKEANLMDLLSLNEENAA